MKIFLPTYLVFHYNSEIAEKQGMCDAIHTDITYLLTLNG